VSVTPGLQRLVLLQWGRTCEMLILIILPIIAFVIIEWLPRKRKKGYLCAVPVLAGGWALAHGMLPTLIILAVCGWTPFLKAFKKLRTSGSINRLFSWLTVASETGLLLLIFFIFCSNVKEKGFEIQTQEKQWVAARQWAKKSTPKDALFLTPSDKMGFRVFSERSVYFAWDDIGSIMWNPHLAGAVMETTQEIKKLGLFIRPYHNASQQKIVAFCKTNSIDYLVLPTNFHIDIKPCYENNKWAIYALSKFPATETTRK